MYLLSVKVCTKITFTIHICKFQEFKGVITICNNIFLPFFIIYELIVLCCANLENTLRNIVPHLVC